MQLDADTSLMATFCSYAYAFYTALHLPHEEALKIHELVEDVIAQADEVGDHYYQVWWRRDVWWHWDQCIADLL